MTRPRPISVFLAYDHGGRSVGRRLSAELAKDFSVQNLTPHPSPGDDYPVAASKLARVVRQSKRSFGIGLCRSGAGMVMVANKFAGVRAAQAWSGSMAQKLRQDDDANIIIFGADYQSLSDIKRLSRIFLRTKFRPVARYVRRRREVVRYDQSISN